MRLFGKVAVITGAGSGIGRASAILFAREGAKVAVADLNDAGGNKTVDEIKSGGGEAIFVHTDVSVAADAQNLIMVTKQKFGGIDIVFNNAGMPHRPIPVEDFEESLWDRIYAVNVKAIFLMAKYVFPVMKAAGRGNIINLASVSGIRPREGSCAYSTSKAAAIHLTKELALEGAKNNIRVNCINPVAVNTPMFAGFMPEGTTLDESRKMLRATVPLGRLAEPEDIAYAALYLASDESSMLTGTNINVDGGRGI